MEEEKKKKRIPFCPISLASGQGTHICLQENCAWWVSSTKTCVMFVVAHNNILDIKEKQGRQNA